MKKKSLLLHLLLTVLACSALTARAQITNVFDFNFTLAGSGDPAGTGTLTFETGTATGTFSIASLSDVTFHVDIVAPGYEFSGALTFSDNGEGEQLQLSGDPSSREISFFDPTEGVNTQFSGFGFQLVHSDNSQKFEFNTGGPWLTNVGWTATDATSAIPEPGAYAMMAAAAAFAAVILRRRSGGRVYPVSR